MRQLPRTVPGLIAACLLLAGAIASAQSPLDDYTPVTEQMLVDPPPGDWPMWRRTYNHWGHSPLDQIDTSNVGGLRLAWAWTMAEGLQETTPLVHDGVMFLVQACDYVEALDVRDGTRLWEYRRPRVEHGATLACASRNGTLYEDKLFIGTHDAHLVALDARTGEVVWDVTVGDWEVGQHYSGGPQVIKGRVVAGMSGCYYLNTRCWISAHDAETGEEVWRTYTIPREGEFGYDSWGDIPDELRRGGSSWNAPSYDPELNLIYAGVGVPIPWGSVQRGTGDGDVLYTNSTLALDADTGEIVWYFQHTPNDEWDLDHPYARLVVETVVSPDPDAVEWLNGGIIPGSRRKIVTGIPGKTGIVWALDAATGAFLWAEPTNRQNVVADVDAESRRVLLNEALKFPQVGEPVFVCPSLTGGINWNATAYHPRHERSVRTHQQRLHDPDAERVPRPPGLPPRVGAGHARGGAGRRRAGRHAYRDGHGDRRNAVGASPAGRHRRFRADHRRRAGVRDRRRAPLPGVRRGDRRHPLGADPQLQRRRLPGELPARRRAVRRHRGRGRGQLPDGHTGDPAAAARQRALGLPASLSRPSHRR